MRRVGFTDAGLNELLAVVGLPKGSFYNYFPSKEAFAVETVEAFYAWQRESDRLAVLKTGTDGQMRQLKYGLLEMLRAVDVYVLERGAIDQYYPDTITGGDKPSRAQDFCAKVVTREAVLDCCGEQEFVRNGTSVRGKEFSLIFEPIFRGRAQT